MKLSGTQIQELQNLIKSNGVKYYDVQMELLDHFVIALEEETEMSFNNKTKLIFEDFGGKEGLQHIVKEKKHAVTKRFLRYTFNLSKHFFHYQKLF